MWQEIDASWSTPCGHYFKPYGVLHMTLVSGVNHLNRMLNRKPAACLSRTPFFAQQNSHVRSL